MRKGHREKMLDEAPETAFSGGQHSRACRIQKQALGGPFSCDSKRPRLPRYLLRDSELTRSREIVGLGGFAVNVSRGQLPKAGERLRFTPHARRVRACFAWLRDSAWSRMTEGSQGEATPSRIGRNLRCRLACGDCCLEAAWNARRFRAGFALQCHNLADPL